MTTSIDFNEEETDILFERLEWLTETGVWNGREVTWENASELQSEIETRLTDLLFSREPESIAFEQLAMQFAAVGVSQENQTLLAREIEQLQRCHNGTVMQAGFWKSAQKFWKEHKKEILIGIGIVAVVATVTIIVVCSAGTASGAVAAGAVALDQLASNNDPSPSTPKPIPQPSSPKFDQYPPPHLSPPSLSLGSTFPSPVPPSPLSLDKPSDNPNGFAFGNEYFTYGDILKQNPYPTIQAGPPSTPPTPPSTPSWTEKLSNIFVKSFETIGRGLIEPELLDFNSPMDPVDKDPSLSNEKPWYQNPFETIGKGLIDPALLNFDSPLDPITQKPLFPLTSSPFEILDKWIDSNRFDPNLRAPAAARQSSFFRTEGYFNPSLRFGGINGMNTSLAGALSHAQYIKGFTSDLPVDWVHNCSHTVPVDSVEIFSCNYPLGYSPNTSRLLINQWTEFHKENKNNPNAKYLQFCHSQGAIHVKNALKHLPKEIRNRIIVVAIAPATVVPKKMCYNSYNYVSKNDIVHYGELVIPSAIDTSEYDDYRLSPLVEVFLEDRKELIFLDPHPNAVGIDHDFQSPTYESKIRDHIDQHLENNGVYL